MKYLSICLFCIVAVNSFCQQDTTREVSEHNPYGYLLYDSDGAKKANKSSDNKVDKSSTNEQNASAIWEDPYILSSADSAAFVKTKFRQGGIGFSKLQSEFLSAVTYGGLSFRTYSNSEKFIKNTYRRFSSGAYFTYFSRSPTDNTINQFGLQVDYSFLVKIKSNRTKNFRIYVGPTSISDLVIDLKLDNSNNPIGYRFGHTLDISGMLYYRFKSQRFFAISFFVDLPLISVVSVPDYASTIPAEFYENGGIFSVLSFKTIGQYTRLRTMLNIEFSFKKRSAKKPGTTWRVTYLYDGGSISEPKKYGFSNQVFMIGRKYRIFKY